MHFLLFRLRLRVSGMISLEPETYRQPQLSVLMRALYTNPGTTEKMKCCVLLSFIA